MSFLAWVAWWIMLQGQQGSLSGISNQAEICAELHGQIGPLSWLCSWATLPTLALLGYSF